MFELIKEEDKNVLNNSNFAKNAVFFKDMLSFYGAYDKIMKEKNDLPNFCYLHDHSICLEGVCLLVKMYATEFKFETIKLSLDYLKILYYSIASYSDDGKTADREIIVAELDKYREASVEFCAKNKAEIDEIEAEYNKQKNKYISEQTRGKNYEVSSKFCGILSIILYVFSLAGAGLAWLCSFYVTSLKNTITTSVLVLLSILIVATITKILSKKFLRVSAEIDYKSQVLKKTNEERFVDLNLKRDKFNKIFCEKYEYKTCFSEIFSRYGKVLTVEQILEKARKYKLLSYNIVYDLNRLFKSQQKDIDELVRDIENIVLSEDSGKDFSLLYGKIANQDWLYYNSEIRMHFLKKFADFAEKQHEWKLNFEQSKINPFDIKVRDLSREKVTYLYTAKNKVISANLVDLMHTNYLKNIENLNLKSNFSIESLKNVKSHYLRYFYNHDIIEAFHDQVYIKKGKKFVVDQEKLKELEMIPTFVNLKLKLIEDSLGLGNSDANVIKSMSQSLFSSDDQPQKDIVLSETDIYYPKVTSSETYVTDNTIIYNVNGRKIVGSRVG